MKVVLTNDDGVEARGLRLLCRALTDEGLDVTVCGPSTNVSGAARGATYGRPVVVDHYRSEDLGVPVFSCRGTPVDSVRVALLTEIASDADLVVSGMNQGANLGDDILVSGTVGAAIEAALLGFPALVVSQQARVGHFHILDPEDVGDMVNEGAAAIGAAFAAAVGSVGAPPRALLNVNVPAEPNGVEVQVTRPGERYYREVLLQSVDCDGVDGYSTFGERGGVAPAFESATGTDFAAVAQGHISASPLSFSWRSYDNTELFSWADEVAKRAKVRLLAASLRA